MSDSQKPILVTLTGHRWPDVEITLFESKIYLAVAMIKFTLFYNAVEMLFLGHIDESYNYPGHFSEPVFKNKPLHDLSGFEACSKILDYFCDGLLRRT